MANEQELQAEIANSEVKLAELTKEANSLEAARFSIGVDNERVKDMDRKLFEAGRQVMEAKIALLDVEKAPLLERLRVAQAATATARAAYDAAFKALQKAEQVEHDAGVPLSTNAFARMTLTDEIEQQQLERSLALKAQATGKPVLAVLGTNGRPGLNQPAFEVRR